MVNNIIWSKNALLDLKDIFDYISNDPSKLSRIKIILNSVDSLYKYPKIGKKIPEIANFNYYEITNGNYRIIFKSTDNNSIINILAIVHIKDYKTQINYN